MNTDTTGSQQYQRHLDVLGFYDLRACYEHAGLIAWSTSGIGNCHVHKSDAVVASTPLLSCSHGWPRVDTLLQMSYRPLWHMSSNAVSSSAVLAVDDFAVHDMVGVQNARRSVGRLIECGARLLTGSSIAASNIFVSPMPLLQTLCGREHRNMSQQYCTAF